MEGAPPSGSWDALVHEVVDELDPDERASMREWAASAKPSARNREALLDRIGIQWG